ncbi:MAG TPA: hypothetical protein DIU15_05850, partial [Deltaproteobacteria bacterium]|nr:hypothetical protein [Deltaproteobacteria bacterium]
LRAFLTAADVLSGPYRGGLYDLDQQFQTQRLRFPDLEHRGQLLAFANPPFVAVLLSPLAELSTRDATLAVAALNLTLSGLCCWLLGLLLAGRPTQQRLVVCLALLGFLPLWVCLWQGQLSLVLLVASLAFLAGLKNGWDFSAGLALAGLLIKPQLLPLPLLLLLVQGRGKALAGLALGSAGAFALGLTAGPSATEQWLALGTSLVEGSGHSGLYPGRMFTIRSALFAVLGREAADLVQQGWLAAVVVLTAALSIHWRKRPPSSLPSPTEGHPQHLLTSWSPVSQGSMALAGALLVSPHAYTHDLLLVVPAAAVLVCRAIDRGAHPGSGNGPVRAAALISGIVGLWLLPWLPLIGPIPPGLAAAAVLTFVLVLLASRER